MLFLFKGTSGTVTATIAGIGAVAAAGSTVSAMIAGVGGVGAPNSVELMIYAGIAGAGTVTAISQGFLSRSASVDGLGGVTAFGGYGTTTTIAGLGNVTATVGSFFDGGAVSISGLGAVTAAGRFVPPNTLIAGSGSVAGFPIISGGTISSAATVTGIGTLSVSLPVQSALGAIAGQGDVLATGQYAILTLATQMRLSFSADEIRTFFRRG